MKLMTVYLRSKRGVILVFLLFALVFAAVFALYRLPPGAVLYPAVLCALLGLLALALDFRRVKNKHETLQTLLSHADTLGEELPAADGVWEQDYQALVRSLRQARLELQTADSMRYRDMVEYYTVWAHQIKTPIAAMKLTLQNEDTPLTRRLAGDLFRIEQYVEMVLTFLRLDSEQSDYVFRRHRLDDIIRPALHKFAPQFIDRRLSLRYETIDETVVTDDKWLSFVLEQLLSNALKYTREGGIHIYMSAPMSLCIADTGIGIAASDLPRIFDKGYTGFNGRADKSASGIGLYLCKRICDGLGIGISAESKPAQGTVMRLDLSQYTIKSE